MKKLFVFASILLLVCASTLATGCASATPSSASNTITMESPQTTLTQNFIFVGNGTNTLADILKGSSVLAGLGEKIVTVVNVGVAGVYARENQTDQAAVPILQPGIVGDKPISEVASAATAYATGGGSTLLNAATGKAKTIGDSSESETPPIDPVQPIHIPGVSKPVASGSNGSQ